MRVARRTATATVTAVLATAPLVAVTPEAAQAVALSLSCRAHMSDSTPTQFSTDYVLIGTARFARVRTVAHFKTTTTAHRARANRLGRARVAYRISDATPGFRARVTVKVAKNGQVAHCATSFVPHRR